MGLVLLGVAAVVMAALPLGRLPRDLLLAWPLYLVASAPHLVLVTNRLLLTYQHSTLTGTSLPHTAGQWVKSRARRLGLSALRVEHLGDLGVGSFYHGASNAIGLAGPVHDAHSVAAHATAAHELGHAWVTRHAPVRARLGTWSRKYAGRLFHWGMGGLFGAAMIGEPAILPAALGFLGVALGARLLIVLEEASASEIALRELQAVGFSAAQMKEARHDLRWALSTYGLHALGHAVPLLLAPYLCQFFGDGLLTPGHGWSALHAQLASATAWVALGCSAWLLATLVIATCFRNSFAKLGLGSWAVLLLGLFCATVMTLLTWHQPVGQAAPVAAALAAWAQWALVFAPISRLLGFLGTAVVPSSAKPDQPSTVLAALRLQQLLACEPEPGARAQLLFPLLALLPTAPLALTILGS
ncbi:MAG: zinc metallopeptidase [Myxococcales bacterium]|nr:zinc metallopeptidase [Myxococcales bacterium]